jgi:hypothetical protein
MTYLPCQQREAAKDEPRDDSAAHEQPHAALQPSGPWRLGQRLPE